MQAVLTDIGSFLPPLLSEESKLRPFPADGDVSPVVAAERYGWSISSSCQVSYLKIPETVTYRDGFGDGIGMNYDTFVVRVDRGFRRVEYSVASCQFKSCDTVPWAETAFRIVKEYLDGVSVDCD